MSTSYEAFLAAKTCAFEPVGFDLTLEPSPHLWPWQYEIVRWACKLGRAACFASTGLGKTRMQLTWAHAVYEHTGKPVLILAPLAVSAQTVREAQAIGIGELVRQVREPEDVTTPIVVTNYERFERFDCSAFAGVVLDESSVLKSYSGPTKKALCERFADTPYRLCCTATPAPNDHLELGNHSEFLGVMSSHRMIARWFINDQSEFMSYRLKGHAVVPFWDWVTSWARCIGKPSDMGAHYDDSGYILPPLEVEKHIIDVDIVDGRADGALFRVPELSATSVHHERRRTAASRALKVAELVAEEPDEPWLVWVDTDYDAEACKAALPARTVEVHGRMDADEKASKLLAFADAGGILLTKPKIAGLGLNLQRCARMVFAGGTYSFESFYQAVRRCWRYGQTRPVDVHIVMGATEANVMHVLDRKAADHEVMKDEMFAASRRAQAKAHTTISYHPNVRAPLPSWLRSEP